MPVVSTKTFGCNKAWAHMLELERDEVSVRRMLPQASFPLCFPAYLTAMFWAHDQFFVLLSVYRDETCCSPESSLTAHHLWQEWFPTEAGQQSLCKTCCLRTSCVFPAPWPAKFRCLGEQEDSCIKLDNWPLLCHVLKGGSPRQEPVRNCQHKEQRLGRGDWWPKDGLEESTPSLPLPALQAAAFICLVFVFSLCFQNMVCLLTLVQKGFEASGWGWRG